MTSPILDKESIETLKDIVSEDAFFSALGYYLQEMEVTRRNFPEKLEEGDARAVEEMMHSLKSSSATFGAFNARDICEKIEQLAEAGRLPEIFPLQNTFEQILAETIECLQKYRQST